MQKYTNAILNSKTQYYVKVKVLAKKSTSLQVEVPLHIFTKSY